MSNTENNISINTIGFGAIIISVLIIGFLLGILALHFIRKNKIKLFDQFDQNFEYEDKKSNDKQVSMNDDQLSYSPSFMGGQQEVAEVQVLIDYSAQLIKVLPITQHIFKIEFHNMDDWTEFLVCDGEKEIEMVEQKFLFTDQVVENEDDKVELVYRLMSDATYSKQMTKNDFEPKIGWSLSENDIVVYGCKDSTACSLLIQRQKGEGSKPHDIFDGVIKDQIRVHHSGKGIFKITSQWNIGETTDNVAMDKTRGTIMLSRPP